MGLSLFDFQHGLALPPLGSATAVLAAVLLLAALDISQRLHHKTTHLIFACVVGTVLSVILLKVGDVVTLPGWKENAYLMALLVVCLWISWKALFGPWDEQTKAAMLGTFLFWIALRIIMRDDPAERTARLIASVTALIPACIWCRLFLEYHRERLTRVLLMFFAGMLSTAPVLFYDALVTRNIELQFFLFRIVPESFHEYSQGFVASALHAAENSNKVVLVSLISFVLVGVLEEISKFWVLKRSCQDLASSIDDVMELSIIVAIGFAFAENIINPTYFTGFVQQYLLLPESPDILGFLSNVLGRSVLTTMVHVVSTGILGYFLGLAMFAGPVLAEQKAAGRFSMIVASVHRLLGLSETSVFRTQMLTTGIVVAICCHGLFNFLVTLPDILPNNPKTIADILGVQSYGLQYIPFLLIPALTYVVGGFWLLTSLFARKEAMKERGCIVKQEVFVDPETQRS